ncbi:hypothetical protein LCGC14_1850480 [marine sediment metagenome]|uniref:Transcription factor TFIIB cyclin-like domain-containing protein n=1 Tax=marine sediment metagenome TaxID=412755 RepID=A0A0F9GAI1_9ZZZZ|nr:hypothetical protein [archaeon]
MSRICEYSIQINRICNNLKLPNNVKHDSLRLFVKALKKGLMRGHSICGIVRACIFHVSKASYSSNL